MFISWQIVQTGHFVISSSTVELPVSDRTECEVRESGYI